MGVTRDVDLPRDITDDAARVRASASRLDAWSEGAQANQGKEESHRHRGGGWRGRDLSKGGMRRML